MAAKTADATWRERAQRVVPGGMYGHLSTRLLPDSYPQFFERSSGTKIWDVNGNEYVDYMCAFGPNLFGYGDSEIDDAYSRGPCRANLPCRMGAVLQERD